MGVVERRSNRPTEAAPVQSEDEAGPAMSRKVVQLRPAAPASRPSEPPRGAETTGLGVGGEFSEMTVLVVVKVV